MSAGLTLRAFPVIVTGGLVVTDWAAPRVARAETGRAKASAAPPDLDITGGQGDGG